jgi:PST family polysaccharide transporter
LLSGGLGLAVQIVATVVLARLLTPGDFGVVAMVTTFSLLLSNFGLNGFTEAVLQRANINHSLVSNLFWINLGSGVALTLGFGAAGAVLARIFNDPRVTHVALGMSVTIFISSLSVLHLALLKRAMRFSALSANDIVARTSSVGLSIVLGWAGWGYWALVAGAIVLPLSVAIGAWVLCRWIPGLPRRVEGTSSMVRFALSVYGRFTVNYSTRNMDNLLVGWRFSAISLGFYKKAYDLFSLPATQLVGNLSVVAISALSRLSNDKVQYRQYLLNVLSVLALAGMGISGVLALIGKDLIRLLLGPHWDMAGRIFTFFAPGIGIMLIYHTHGWIHLSIGRADRWLRWGIVEVTVTGLLFVLALPWGPVGVAIAWGLSFWILIVPAFLYAGAPIDFPTASLFAMLWKYILAALAAWGGSTVILNSLPFMAVIPGAMESFFRILFVSSLFGILYIGMVILLHRGQEPIRQALDLVREMIPWKTTGLVSANELPSDYRVANSVLTVMGETSLQNGQSTEYMGGNVKSPDVSSQPLVSILIPAFNAQEWIADTLRSALAQTWKRTEIIVVDDGSSDQTYAIALQFKPLGVMVVRQENQGACAARNNALSLSHGDYIQWLDSDDLLAPDKIARQMEVVMQGVDRKTLLSCKWARFMYRKRCAQLIPTALWCDLTPVEWLLRKMDQNIYMQTATWLVSRELTDAAGQWNTKLTEDDDGEYFCRVLLASNGVRFVPDAMVYYRSFGFDSLSYIGRSPSKLESHWLSMRLHIRHLRSLEESQRVHAACLRYLRTSLVYFYPERLDIVSQAEQMAMEFGERLGAPVLSWKYSWIEKVFGWGIAKPAQRYLRKLHWSVEKRRDRLLFHFEGRMLPVLSRRRKNQETDVTECAQQQITR